MRKFQAYSWVVVLAVGGAFVPLAQAEPRYVGDGEQQILFESLLYNGGTEPNLQDKHPDPARVEASGTLLPAVVFEEGSRQQVSSPAKSAIKQTPPPAQPRQILQQTQYNVTPTAATYSSPGSASNLPGNDLYRRARAGDPDAEYQVGMLFAQDHAINKTQGADQSLYWFTQAASKGHKRAQYNLGVMHAQGEGTVQNLIEAYSWFNLSAAQQMEGATEARDMVATSLTPDALMKAQERSTLYQQKISQNLAQMEKNGAEAIVPIR